MKLEAKQRLMAGNQPYFEYTEKLREKLAAQRHDLDLELENLNVKLAVFSGFERILKSFPTCAAPYSANNGFCFKFKGGQTDQIQATLEKQFKCKFKSLSSGQRQTPVFELPSVGRIMLGAELTLSDLDGDCLLYVNLI